MKNSLEGWKITCFAVSFENGSRIETPVEAIEPKKLAEIAKKRNRIALLAAGYVPEAETRQKEQIEITA
jgi:hypothetical protein